MSKSEILYVKGMNMSESEGEEDNEEDIWDDTKLNDAYDKALRIASAEVAKRVAMSTNTKHTTKDCPSSNKKSSRVSSSKGKEKETHWKVGMPCRAIYEGDGLEYEAFVLRIINDKECIVRFLGYENSEIVLINTLKETLGNDERTHQIEQALNEKTDDGFASQSPNPENLECASERATSPGSIDILFQKKKKSSKKKKPQNPRGMSGFELPEMPLPMPNMSMFKNLGPTEMPMPPPPPMSFPTLDRSDNEEQAISSMLLSWYMSGYYTGLYQGLKRSKANRSEL